MIDLEIDTRPIVIVANFRTRSTPLTIELATKYSLNHHVEPSVHDLRYKIFIDNYYNIPNYSNFVLKIMSQQLDDLPEYKKIFETSCYKIKLKRQDKISQIASYYLSIRTKRWAQLKQHKIMPFNTRIVPSLIRVSIEHILKNDRLLDEFPYEFNKTIFSEDIPCLKNTVHVYSSKPENYQEIIDAVKFYYNEFV